MSLLTIDLFSLSLLNRPESPFRRPDGTVNIQALISGLDNLNPQVGLYSFSPTLYYFLTLSGDDPLLLDFRQRVFSIVSQRLELYPDKINSQLQHFFEAHLPELHARGVAYAEPLQTFLHQALPKNGFSDDLFLFGAHVYLQQGIHGSKPLSQYLPTYDYASLTPADGMSFGLKYHLEYERLIRICQEEPQPAIARFLTYAHFARTCARQVKKKYQIGDAIAHVWPLMHAQGIDLKDSMRELRRHLRGRTYFMDILDWVQNVSSTQDPLTQQAIVAIRSSMDDEMKKALQKKSWGSSEYGWASLLIDLSPNDSLYAPTRDRIADAILSARSVASFGLSQTDVFALAARAGSTTFRRVMSGLKAEKRLDYDLQHLLKYASSTQRSPIVQHPVFQGVFDLQQLFHRQMGEIHALMEGTFMFWRDIVVPNQWHDTQLWNHVWRSFRPEQVSGHILNITKLHMEMNTDRSLKDTLSPSMYAQLWGCLALHVFLQCHPNSLECPNHYGSLVLSANNGLDLPHYIQAIIALDPAFAATHDADVQKILKARHLREVQSIYMGWVESWLGGVYKETGVLEHLIYSPDQMLQFFGSLYAQNHPELGLASTATAIEIGDLM